MKDEWSLYSIEKDDGTVWHVRKNIKPLRVDERRAKYSACMYLTVHYEREGANGFPTSADNDALELLEEELTSVCAGDHSVLVATVFMPGLKDFIMYCADAERLTSVIEKLVTPFSSFRFEIGGHADPDWTQYDAFQ